MAAPTTGLTVIKRFKYRADSTEEFSNSYWFTGSTPADDAAWRTLFNALVAEEKKIYPAATQVIAGYGYDSVDDHAHAVWTVDLTISPETPVNGTLATAGAFQVSGDAAVWVRWGLDRLNSKGKRIYLRKYFHPAFNDGTPINADVVVAAQTTALAAFGTKLRDGSFATSRVTTDKLGTAVLNSGAGPYITTRTLKRRGKRPPT